MTRPANDVLSECDPLPPGDRLVEADWRAGVDQLYRDRATGLIHHFAARTRDHEIARDLVHEAFAKLSALTCAARLSIIRPDAYLFRTCINLLFDRGRAEAARRALEEAIKDTAESDHPVVQLECRDTLRRLEKAMLRLKPKTRAIFLARRLDGLSYAEIAERTGLTIWGVEKQMAKAIATIDRLMERD